MIFTGPASVFAGAFGADEVAGSVPGLAPGDPFPPLDAGVLIGALLFVDCDLLSSESDFVATWIVTMIPTTGITIPTTHQAHFG
ncbi:hypothetical protein [Embleya sp. NPDC020630]|uniref:hypothetical protein n=1 Tax=unclassified Embleya TaxID=2699296 RepID=UPI0037A3C2DA